MNFNNKINNRLAKLNFKQLEAVKKTEGPVMLLAGPGTGKTETLASRIAFLLSSPDLDLKPENILCLTYTEAGVIAMKKRLQEFLGASSYLVNIHTFHSLSNKIIQENLDYFGFDNLEPLSDLEEVFLLREIIDEIPVSSVLFKKGSYYEIKRLRNLFNLIKKEYWSEDYLLKKSEDYLKDLENREEFYYQRNGKNYQKGDLKVEKLEREKRKNQQFQEAVKLFKVYQEKKLKINRYDYNDMILWVINALKRNPELLLKYQEEFLYFCVDEYQDTNGAQNELLFLLTNFWDNPNLFVVGDDDQAIFKFQGANMENLSLFLEKFPQSSPPLVLTDNYRSTQKILDISEDFIDNNEERLINNLNYQISKNLLSKNKELKEEDVFLFEFKSIYEEEMFYVKDIKERIQKGEKLSSIAVIYRNHKQVENLLKIFATENIPTLVKKSINIYDLPIINNLIKIFNYLIFEKEKPNKGETLLFEILHFFIFEIKSKSLALLFNKNAERKERRTLKELALDRQFFLEYTNDEALFKTVELLNNWSKDMYNYTPSFLLQKILTDTDFFAKISQDKDAETNLKAVYSLFLKFEEEQNKGKNLADIFNQIKTEIEENISRNINLVLGDKEGVNFITAHSAKGLEFNTVYLFDVNERVWDKNNNNQSDYSLPDNLFSSLREKSLEEERRLFYVALTRAKQNLILTYNLKNHNDKDQISSRFIQELLETKKINFKKTNFNLKDNFYYLNRFLKVDLNEKTSYFFNEKYIENLLEGYTLSPTHLNKYLKCPVTFYFETIVKIPSVKNPSLVFGTIMHKALEDFLTNSKKKGKILDQESLKAYFLSSLEKNKNQLTELEYSKFKNYGLFLLKDYYQERKDSFILNTYTEERIKTKIGTFTVKTSFDRLDVLDNKRVRIIDYKTGKSDDIKKKIKAPSLKVEYGGDYWRQLAFYQLVYQKTSPFTSVESVGVDFLEKDKNGKFLQEFLSFTQEDLDFMEDLIKKTYHNIMNHKFFQTCEDKDCYWCNFWRKLK
jgi:DNA helicase-2/ATP-dependent DNA helicase PcrA